MIHYDGKVFDNTQEGKREKESRNEWDKIISTGMTFRLDLAPEEHAQSIITDIPSPVQQESRPLDMIQDYNFATLFTPLDSHPFPRAESVLTFEEWRKSASGLSSNIKSMRRQALKMQRRKSSLHFKSSK